MKKFLFITCLSILIIFELKSKCPLASPKINETKENKCFSNDDCDRGRKCSKFGWCENCSLSEIFGFN